MSAYEQYLNSLQKEDQGKNQLVASLSEAATANPDEFANMVKLSRAAKVSVDAVADYKTEAQQAKYLGEVGLDRLWRDAPKTANFLTEPDNAKLAKDDHENLTGIEGVFDYLKNRGRAVGAAIPKMNAGLWGMAAAPFELLGVDSVGGYLRDQQKITDRMAKSWGPQDKPGWMTNAIDQGLTSAGQQLLTLPMAFLPGGQNATLSAMVAPVFGESYGKARDKGLSPAQSIQYGTQDAAAEWVFERYGLGNLVQNVKSGTGYGRTLVEFMLREVPSEMATTVVQSFNEYANLNPDKPVGEWAAQLPDELAQTVVATLVGGGAIATTAKAVDGVVRAAESRLNKADEANQMADMLGRINQHIAASATLARDPATFQKFIESATEDGPVQTVFIDGKTLAQSGIAEQLAAVSPAVAEQLQTAIETGGQVAIPVVEYATAIAPTEFAQSLLDHIKVDPEGFSRAEAKEYMQSHADDLQREVERVIGEQADDTAFRQSVETVKTNIKQQLDTAARFTPQVNDAYAAMVGNFYAVMGAKTGNTPEELFAKYPLRVQAESVAGGQTYGQAARQFDGALADMARVISPENNAFFVELPTATDGAAQTIKEQTGINVSGARVISYGSDVLSDKREHPNLSDADWENATRLLSAFGRVGRSIAQKGAQGERITLVKDIGNGESYGAVFEVLNSKRHGRRLILKSFVRDKSGSVNSWFDANTREKLDSSFMPAGGDSRLPNNADGAKADPLESSTDSLDQDDNEYNQSANDGPGYIVNAVMQDAKGDIDKALGLIEARKKDLEGVKQFLVPGAYEIEKRDLLEAARRIAEGEASVADKPTGASYTPEGWAPDAELIAMAKKVFGVTRNPMEAGYVLPDGTMLDFSGRHYSTRDNWPYLRDQRSVDHRELHSENLKGQSLTDLLESSGSEGMYEFMARTGAMRIDANSGVASIARPPTAKQIATIGNARKGDYAALSFNRPDGQIISDGEIESATPAKVKKFFDDALTSKSSGGAYAQGENANRGSFNPATNTITLLKNADLSTFLHESGHFFLETQLDIASRIIGLEGRTPGEQQLLDDTDALLKWFGIRDLTEWGNLDFEERRSYHEKFARGFEAYLFEGKSPSIEMQGLFQRFRAWMLNVYRELKNLNVELTDEVRGVFDRMLATNEQIQIAEQGRSLMPLFESAEQAGMTVEEFAAYQALGVDATNEAVEDLQARGLRDMQWLHNARGRIIKKLQREAKETRAAVQMEVRKEVMSQPLYRAWAFLTGRLTDDDKLETPKPPKSDPNVLDETMDSLFVAIGKLGGLNKDEVLKTWGTDPADKPASGVFGKPLWRINGGLSIDGMREALAQYGYNYETLQDFEEAFNSELRGNPVYSSSYAPEQFDLGRPGDQVVNPDGLTAGPFNLDSLTEIGLPAEIVQHLKALKMTAKDGMHPDIVAERFGFSSGDELVRRIAAAEEPKAEIEALTDVRMLEAFGELATPEAIERAADKAIHNDVRARMIATEANALEKATGQRKTLSAAAKSFAAGMIARLKIRNVKPGQYAGAEVRAAKAAQKSSMSGDLATAAAEKRNQLIQHHATRAAYDAQDEIERGLRYLKKFDGTVKGLDVDYADQIAQLLERFDLRKQSQEAVDKRTALAAWVESQREQGLEPAIPPDLLNEAFRKSYRDMTVEEFRGLIDTVQQIEHLGRLKNKLLTAADQRAYAAVRDEMVASILDNADGRKADARTPDTLTGKALQKVKQFWSSHIKSAMWARIMDGGKDGGPVWEYLIRPANERGDMETTMRAEATARLSEILDPVFKLGGMQKKQFFPSIGRSLTREARIAIALNMGNEGNIQRLLGGEGWTVQQLAPVLQSLTSTEWRAVQAVWDHFESYRPLIAAKERRVYGKEPDWVAPQGFSVRTADGESVEMRGGYYPIKYDPAASQRAEEHADAEGAKRQLQGAYTTATTRRSFTKSRAEEVTGRPLLYSLAGVYSGVNDVIHDLAWHEWLIDANRLLRSNTLDAAIRNTYGPEVKVQFKKWVADIAEGDKASTDAGDIAVNYLRQSVSVAGLGFNVMSAAIQPLGLTNSIVRVGARWIGRGVQKYIASPIALTREVNARSVFMANRARTRFRELNELRNQVEGQTKLKEFVGRYAYFLMMRFQQAVDVPTWWGAYEKAIAEGNDETRSRALADQAVIDAQGGGMLKDQAGIERTDAKGKLFTVFYSFMNTTLSLGVVQGMTEKAIAKKTANMLLLYVIPPLLTYALKAALTPGDSGDDDPEKIAKKLLAAQVDFLMGQMVYVREFSDVAKTLAGANDLGRDYQGPAGLRLVADAGKFAMQAGQGEFDDAFRKSAVNLIGDLFGLPSAQINRTITGVEALADGETSNPAAVAFGFQEPR